MAAPICHHQLCQHARRALFTPPPQPQAGAQRPARLSLSTIRPSVRLSKPHSVKNQHSYEWSAEHGEYRMGLSCKARFRGHDGAVWCMAWGSEGWPLVAHAAVPASLGRMHPACRMQLAAHCSDFIVQHKDTSDVAGKPWCALHMPPHANGLPYSPNAPRAKHARSCCSRGCYTAVTTTHR